MKIEVVTEIRTIFVVSDTGYTRSMTLPEVEKWAEDHLRCITVLLQEGGTEPKPVQADMKLIKVIFTPDEEKSR